MKNKHLLLFISLILLLYPINVFSYSQIWGSSGSDVFVVGGNTIRHYDGSTWSDMSSGTTEWLGGVWGSSGSDVFAVGGSGTILHYNGSTWSTMSSGTTNNLQGVWGSSGSDVFAVGGYFEERQIGRLHGTILHYNGSTWSTMLSGTTNYLLGVWGSSGSDVFAVGVSGTILHYNGSTWSTMSSGTKSYLRGVWGSSRNNVFAVGDGGTVLHYNGLTWSSIKIESVTTYNLNLSAICGSSRSDVFAVGFTIVYGSRGGNIYSNTTLHYNGLFWSANTIAGGPPGEYSYYLTDIWVSSSNDVFKVDSGGIIYHHTGPDTGPGGGLCPAQTVMGQNHLALNKIRTLRNEMFINTGLGKYYTARYYKHAFELSHIVANNEELKDKATDLIQRIMPAVETLLAKKETIIDEDTVQKSIEVIDGLKSQASPALEKDLTRLKQDIQNGVIFKTFKVRVQTDEH